MPKISVLTPAFQAKDTLERSVKSVLSQIFSDWEMVIIADDACDYASLLKQKGLVDKRLRVIRTGKNKSGPSHARNCGLDAARSSVIACLDADDAFHPQKLEKMYPLVRQHGPVTSNIRFIDNATEEELPNHNAAPAEGPVDLATSFFVNFHTNSILAFDRGRITCRWDEDITRMEDTVFLAACFDDVDHCYFLPGKLHFYYKRDGSLCNVPDAGQFFAEQSELILALIHQGKIGIRNFHTLSVLERFMKRQLRLELLFQEQHMKGSCIDYQDFLQKNKSMIYDLS